MHFLREKREPEWNCDCNKICCLSMAPYTRAVCRCLQVDFCCWYVPILPEWYYWTNILILIIKFFLRRIPLQIFALLICVCRWTWMKWIFRASLDRMQIEQIGIGQLHWSTANYAPFQELALWDGLVAMYDKVTIFHV